jgi:hypothetical protein
MSRCGLNSSDSRQEPVTESHEHRNETSFFIKRWSVYCLGERLSAFQEQLCSVVVDSLITGCYMLQGTRCFVPFVRKFARQSALKVE